MTTTQAAPVSLALAGDVILNRKVSDTKDPDIQAILSVLKSTDLTFGNCETLFHDYVGPEVYPAVEAGWSYMRSPPAMVGELRDIGFGLMGTANNHMLDYSYGGMFSTHVALDSVGIAHAGSGHDLGAARCPAYANCGPLRVGVVSMATSCAPWARAGMPHEGIPGRPGVNPLRVHFRADRQAMAQIVDLNTRMGNWVAQIGDTEWQVNPPGLHHSVTRYFVSDTPGLGMVLDPTDVAGNLRSIASAKVQADLVIAHIHNHEWDQDRGTAYPADFMVQFAHQAIEAGADIVFAQGSHAPLRGIEVYRGKPIFYDTGDLFSTSNTVTRFPRDFYTRHESEIHRPYEEALPSDGVKARALYHLHMTKNPPGGYQQGRGRAGIVPVLRYQGTDLTRVELHPFLHRHDTVGNRGLPYKPNEGEAAKILSDLQSLSEPYGNTTIGLDGTIGVLDLQRHA